MTYLEGIEPMADFGHSGGFVGVGSWAGDGDCVVLVGGLGTKMVEFVATDLEG